MEVTKMASLGRRSLSDHKSAAAAAAAASNNSDSSSDDVSAILLLFRPGLNALSFGKKELAKEERKKDPRSKILQHPLPQKMWVFCLFS